MTGGLQSAVQAVARFSRQSAAWGAIFLSIRLVWLSGGDAVAHARGQMDTKETSSSVEKEGDEATDNPHRPDFEKLKEQLDGVVNPEPPEIIDPVEVPGAKLRRILVDVGPERSEVYIGGRWVGQTPYLGQYSCLDGDQLKIEVLPPTGAPIVRTAICRGETVTAAH